jgi:hypothetical protein
VAARLDLLSAEEKSLLQDAAAIGRVFWPGAIGAAEDALHSLVRKEFVRRERRSSIAGESEYSFAHALVRDVAYGQIPRGARAERHRRAAEWIESLPADRAVDRAEMLAHHYAAAIELGGAAGADTSALREPARRAFRDAGDRAASLNAQAAAVRFYTAALELWPEDDPERPAILLARTEALILVGGDPVRDAEEAVALLNRGSDAEATAAAEMTLARAYWQVARGGEGSEHAGRAQELLAHAPPSPAKALVLVERARLLMLSGRSDEAEPLATEGLELSEMLGLERLQASALITRGASRGGDDGLADMERGAAIAESCNAVDQLYRAFNNISLYHFYRGELDASTQSAARIRALATQYGHVTQLWWVDGQDVSREHAEGAWDRALELANSIVAVYESGQRHYLASSGFMVRSHIRHARGDTGALEDGETAVEHARRVGDLQTVAPVLGGHARLLALEGRRAEARALLEEVLDAHADARGLNTAWLPPLVWAFALVGEPGEHQALLDRAPPGPWVDAARAASERDFAAAADLYASMGALTPEAEARVLAAEVLLERGDRPGSEAQLARAIAFYRTVRASRRLGDAEKLLAATA